MSYRSPRPSRRGDGAREMAARAAPSRRPTRLPHRLGGLALLLLLLPRPDPGEVAEALRPETVDRGAGHAEGHALDGGGADDLRPGRLLRRRLRRLLLVEDAPDGVEQLLADQAGHEAEHDAERLVEDLHGRPSSQPSSGSCRAG